ncbi:hypothetical protein EIK77_000129 [Talaromyces pinophilus]|nr:hypothetical protein EIK77_000129 [Talaromyces pinophilus]
MSRRLASSIDWGSLQSLKLRFCIDWESFLENILLSQQQLRLESLEIQSNDEYDDSWNETRTISNFVGAFDGLKELFIAISGPTASQEILQSILQHKATLRNFVYHQRSVYMDEDSRNFERPCDIPDLSFLPRDIKEFRDDQSRNPFNFLDLECLGLCCDPKILVGLSP